MTSGLAQELLIGLGLLAVLFLSGEIGFRSGRRAAKKKQAAPSGGQIGSIQGAILGLLGLLLAFSFGGAATRFLDRQDFIVREANAIGTASLRADLLDEPHRSELLAALRVYTEFRVDLVQRVPRVTVEQVEPEVQRQLHAIWRATMRGVNAKPSSMMGMLPPINEVIDVHSLRVAASKKRLPPPVIALLLSCSMLAIGVVSFGCGVGGSRRTWLTAPLLLLVAGSLWITIDLDHPRSGLLRLDDRPLEALTFDPLAPGMD